MERATGDLPGWDSGRRCRRLLRLQRPYPKRPVVTPAGTERAGASDGEESRYRNGTRRRAMRPSPTPSAAPATMSEVWCIRVYTRLTATAPASANHAGVAGPPARSVAAVNADAAWPDGNELVSGRCMP